MQNLKCDFWVLKNSDERTVVHDTWPRVQKLIYVDNDAKTTWFFM
jgi:hypothetical protein